MMECKYIENCPSRTGWCLVRNGDTTCIPFIKQAIENYKVNIENAEYVLEELKKEDCANLPVW